MPDPIQPASAPPLPLADRSGLILLAHGARDAAWARPFERVAAAVRQARPDAVVTLAFLEFMTPTLEQAGTQLAACGCTQVAVLPLFLGVGGHVRRDIPVQLQQLRHAYPQVHWRLAPPIGEDPRLLQALTAVALSALTNGDGSDGAHDP
ncbi:MAG: CbiX/SirB N-terminal domain-containing protein [Tepidimonas sp.]|uniref:sirohydrochlorin chelatase n=1 Tax=Tepidimonas sp. TaxID=2002775 RepID=UPI00298EDDB2|nr:CbiX/SirB N-terminal domain-containing protein [Tepidimonas sp.]MDW8337142.1 CbiX/SirB N-terminal domain-containing protein [Tepidimonas sp.]